MYKISAHEEGSLFFSPTTLLDWFLASLLHTYTSLSYTHKFPSFHLVPKTDSLDVDRAMK